MGQDAFDVAVTGHICLDIIPRFHDTGARSLGAVEIVSGLEEGEKVIISGIDQFNGAETVLITD